MAVVAPPSRATRPELVINQTHADVTRDVVATLRALAPTVSAGALPAYAAASDALTAAATVDPNEGE